MINVNKTRTWVCDDLQFLIGRESPQQSRRSLMEGREVRKDAMWTDLSKVPVSLGLEGVLKERPLLSEGGGPRSGEKGGPFRK